MTCLPERIDSFELRDGGQHAEEFDVQRVLDTVKKRLADVEVNEPVYRGFNLRNHAPKPGILTGRKRN